MKIEYSKKYFDFQDKNIKLDSDLPKATLNLDISLKFLIDSFFL